MKANSKITDRIVLVRDAVKSGKLAAHAAVQNATADDLKVANAWGPAMRV